MWVLLYYFFRSFLMTICNLFLNPLLFKKVHLRTAMVFSTLLTTGQFSLLLFTEDLVTNNAWYSLLIIPVGILSGLSIYFYWVPYHIFFVRHTDGGDKKFGKEMGWRFFLSKIARTVGPVIGGFVIARWNFGALFLISILLLISCILPVLVSLEEQQHRKHRGFKILGKYFYNPKIFRLTTTFFGQGVESLIYSVFWPVLMFVASKNFVQIGFVNSAAILFSSIACLWIGRLIDRKGNKLVHGIGVFLNSVFYLPRLVLTNAYSLYFLEIIDKVNAVLYSIPLNSQTYEKAQRLGDSDFIVYREIILHTAISLSSLVSFLILPHLANWRSIFIFAAIGSALTYLISWDDN